MAAWGTGMFNMAPAGQTRWARGLYVSGGFFEVVGVVPELGRTLSPIDDKRGCGLPGAVISHGYWERELGGDPNVLGRRLSVDRHPVEIVGVAPQGFHGLDVGSTFDVALPLCAEALVRGERAYLDVRHAWWLGAIGRLAPGWSVERASSYLEASSLRWLEAAVPRYNAETLKKYYEYRFAATPAANGKATRNNDYSNMLYFLLATAGLLLLSPATTWRTCSSRGARRASARSPSGWRSAPRAAGWCASS